MLGSRSHRYWSKSAAEGPLAIAMNSKRCTELPASRSICSALAKVIERTTAHAQCLRFLLPLLWCEATHDLHDRVFDRAQR